MADQTDQIERAVKYAYAEINRVSDPNKLPSPVRTVILIHAAQGIIDNGGLQYFFESDFEGQTPYLVFVDAYREIGAEDAAQALADAVKLFPFPDPHLYQTRRNEFLELFSNDGTHRPDSPFEPYTHILCGNDRVWSLLDQYILGNLDSFPQ